jgi:hypothetical protein
MMINHKLEIYRPKQKQHFMVRSGLLQPQRLIRIHRLVFFLSGTIAPSSVQPAGKANLPRLIASH